MSLVPQPDDLIPLVTIAYRWRVIPTQPTLMTYFHKTQLNAFIPYHLVSAKELFFKNFPPRN
jgi:hypothetical protein